MPAPACFTFSRSYDSKVWRVLTTTDVGIVTPGQLVPEHHKLHICGAQHFEVFCFFFLGGGYATSNRSPPRTNCFEVYMFG